MKIIKLLLLIPVAVYVLTLAGCYKAVTGHECKFTLCPFKGATIDSYHGRCVCDEGSDCDAIDKLHLIYPADSYDELEEKLFN